MAKYLVDDVIHGQQKELTLLNENFLFTVVPKIVLKKFVSNQEVLKDVKALLRAGKYGNPLFYKKDRHLSVSYIYSPDRLITTGNIKIATGNENPLCKTYRGFLSCYLVVRISIMYGRLAVTIVVKINFTLIRQNKLR